MQLQHKNLEAAVPRIESQQKQGDDRRQALKSYRSKADSGAKPSVSLIVAALKECSSFKDLESGRKIHSKFVKAGNYSDIFVECTLVDMYAKCGSLSEARKVFESMQHKNVVIWNIIIQGYAQIGQGDAALDFFSRMQSEGCAANHITYLAALKACISLAEEEQGALLAGKIVKADSLARGKWIHSEARKSGHDRHRFVTSSLVEMYSKCRSITDARSVFEKMSERDLVCWNSTIAAYAQCGEGEEALNLYKRMQEQGCRPNYVTYLAALKACVILAEQEQAILVEGRPTKIKCLEEGRRIHHQAVASGVDLQLFVASTLVDMYAKCGSLPEARKVFESMKIRSVVSWTTIIQGYADNGQGAISLELYMRMLEEEEGCLIKPNDITLIAALKACISLEDPAESLGAGRLIHSQAAAGGFEAQVLVANCLVDLYSKSGRMVEAACVFGSLQAPTVISWTGMILGFAQIGEGDLGLHLFSQMQEEGCQMDVVTYVAALKCCVGLEEGLSKGRRVHKQLAAEMGMQIDTILGSTLVDMYAKCGSLNDARSVFDGMKQKDFVTWNCMLLGYAQADNPHQALELYHTMQQQQQQQTIADPITYVAVLKACGSLAMKDHGALRNDCSVQSRLVHRQAARTGFETQTYVANMLIDTYSKCGRMGDCWRVFESLGDYHSVVSWTALIVGCVDNDDGKQALRLYRQMKEEGLVKPDAVTYVAALGACGLLADLETVANSLVDFYGKCGAVGEARRVFDSTSSSRNLITWNALMDGYSRQGDLQQVLHRL